MKEEAGGRFGMGRRGAKRGGLLPTLRVKTERGGIGDKEGMRCSEGTRNASDWRDREREGEGRGEERQNGQ